VSEIWVQLGGGDGLLKLSLHPTADEPVDAVHLGGDERRVAEQRMLAGLYETHAPDPDAPRDESRTRDRLEDP